MLGLGFGDFWGSGRVLGCSVAEGLEGLGFRVWGLGFFFFCVCVCVSLLYPRVFQRLLGSFASPNNP